MFTIQEQLAAATKANFESQIAILTALTNKTLESVEKVVDLNMNAVKTSWEESAAKAQQLFSAKDPQEFFAASATQVQPNAEKALAYGRHLANIAVSAQAEFTKAGEAQIAETSRAMMSLVDEIAQNAPVGSENIAAFVKSTLNNTNAGYEQFAKSTKQTIEAMEANLNTAASKFSEVATKTGAKAAAKK